MTLDGRISDSHFELTVEQFQEVSSLIYRHCRIQLPVEKMNLVRGRLVRRMADLNLQTMEKYIDVLKRDVNLEMPFLISSITTNVTSFFREQRQLNLLLEKIAPQLISKAERGEPVRIWSAGCSTGEEPYTIASILLSLCDRSTVLNIKILATDVDRNAISYARRGKFDREVISSIPMFFREYLFHGESDVIAGNARSIISFNELNLFSDWKFRGMFDVIFCRNVCIYFDINSCGEIWRKLSERIHTNGFIFVGSSEKISNFDSLNLRYYGEGVYGKMKGKLT